MGRTRLSFAAALAFAVSLHGGQSKERKTPKRPARPFLVFVRAEPRGEVEIEERILRARDEFKEAIDRKDDWFLQVEDAENAEIVAEIKALLVEDENLSEARTSVMGPNTHTSEYLVTGPRYTFYALVTIFGNVVELTGSGRRKDADAASALVKELDGYLKKNYWQLLERRELWHSSGVPAEELGLEWIAQEVTRRVEALGRTVGSIEWSKQTLAVGIEPNEFQFPFPPSGFDECVRTVECQHLMVEQIMDHLEQALGKK